MMAGWNISFSSDYIQQLTRTPASVYFIVGLVKLALSLHINFLSLISETFWLSLLTSTFVVVQSTQQCRSTYSVWGRYLKDHVILSENVKNIGVCYIQCSMNQRCKSINFKFGHLLCELNDADRYTHPWDYVPMKDQAYSDYPVKVCVSFSVPFSSISSKFGHAWRTHDGTKRA